MTDHISDQDLEDLTDPLFGTDALLDDPAAHAGHDELARLLAGWRDEIDSQPPPALISKDMVLAVGTERPWPSWWLALLIAVLLVLAGALGGVLGVWIALH